jgi:hypothetical protein
VEPGEGVGQGLGLFEAAWAEADVGLGAVEEVGGGGLGVSEK